MGVIDGALRKLGQEICGVCKSAIKEGLQGGSAREIAPSCGFRRPHFWVSFVSFIQNVVNAVVFSADAILCVVPG